MEGWEIMTIRKCYERKPSELIKEARMAFDYGLYIAALSVLVTIPDICACIFRDSLLEEGNGSEKYNERWWCNAFLGLPAKTPDCCKTKHECKSPEEINDDLCRRSTGNRFTASDFSQLRNSVLHAGSALVEGTGEKFSPYHAIGIYITDSDSQLIVGTGVTSAPYSDFKETDCSFDVTLSLNALLAKMESAVQRFLQEYPQLNVEVGKSRSIKYGIVDMRTQKALTNTSAASSRGQVHISV